MLALTRQREAAVVARHQGLARRLARRAAWDWRHEFDDMLQWANVGLLDAVRTFDPGRGIKFTTHATWKMRAAIKQGCRFGVHLIHVSDQTLDAIRHDRRDGVDPDDQADDTLSGARALKMMSISDPSLRIDDDVGGIDPPDVHIEPAAEHPADRARRVLDAALETMTGADRDSFRVHLGHGRGHGLDHPFRARLAAAIEGLVLN